MKLLSVYALVTTIGTAASFAPLVGPSPQNGVALRSSLKKSDFSSDWLGEVSSNEGGIIRGCAITPVGEEPVTEWIVQIDGIDADVGRFSEAIYKKITTDAKKQQFQGFRPGTIPPHLEPTYRAYTMDECARETILEALQQNNIQPFSDARNELLIAEVSIPPPVKKSTKKKSKKRKTQSAAEPEETAEVEEEPKWLSFDNMKEAIDAGWKPGQTFSFVATKVKGQKMLVKKDVDGAQPLGLNY